MKNVTVFTKIERFDGFNAVFEYSTDETGAWSFKVSKLGGVKKVEFSNGTTDESMLRHLRSPTKINPKTAIKFIS